MKLGLVTVLMFIALVSFSQSDTLVPQLPNQIIRSSTVTSLGALVGLKGKEKGAGLVYYRSPESLTWEQTNRGKALAKEVEDVQAVAIIDENNFLAGTWKNGLFSSINQGKSWKKVDNFPSKDVRSIQVSRSNPDLIYAATTTHGIVKSTDKGSSWTPCTADSLYKTLAAWSIEIDPSNDSIIYAMTFRNGIYKSTDQGHHWKSVLKQDGIMFYDLAMANNNRDRLCAVGSNDSLGVMYSSTNGGESWAMVTGVPNGALNQVAITGVNQDVFLVGSWDNGAHANTNGQWNKVTNVTFETISDIYAGSKEVIFFTWGNGIYKMKNDWMNSVKE
jgi:hypothetical protein